MPSFALNREIVQKAERYGLDFALSMIKLRGFGGAERVLGPQSRIVHLDGRACCGDRAHQALRLGRGADDPAGDRRAHMAATID